LNWSVYILCQAMENAAYGVFCELIKTKIEYTMCWSKSEGTWIT